MTQSTTSTIEEAVRARYSQAAQATEAALCCPVSYDPKYLKAIPKEILDRDYGCGDPSPYVQPSDTVLDLGSGGGKICFIAAQIAGATGKVIGVDMNTEMLALARKHQPTVAKTLGYDNVTFHRARIQDLALPLDEVDAYLKNNPVRNTEQMTAFDAFVERLSTRAPLIAGESVDVVLSNCVLNLIANSEKEQLFREIYRVLKRGGRIAISDIVSDEDVPEKMQRDPELWSGCLSGAYREDTFLEAFERAGFYGVAFAKYDEQPWRTVQGIQFRSVTVTARKGKEGPCLERKQAVIYKGPWKEVRDDDGHILRRGQRMAVCDKTYKILTQAPYAEKIIPVPPLKEIPLKNAKKFSCGAAAVRDPRETKGKRYRKTTETPESVCGPESCC